MGESDLGCSMFQNNEGAWPSSRRWVVRLPGLLRSKAELVSALRMLLEKRKLKNERKLMIQLNGLTYKVSKTGNLLFESPEKVRLHDD
jgi:hypothetical protein